MARVQSVERAFTILRALSLGPAGVTELSDRTGLPKSTVSRMLSSLQSELAVEQSNDGGYELGKGIGELALALRGGQSAVEVAWPHMIELMDFAGEAVGLSRREGGLVRTLAQIDDPDQSVVVRDWTGETAPMHVVPAGLVILAHSSTAIVKNYLARELERPTSRTMTNTGDLLERFGRIRADGYAWVYGEFTADINSVAAPIADASGRASLAVHIHGPAFRFPPSGENDELGQRVAATAQRIESQLLNN